MRTSVIVVAHRAHASLPISLSSAAENADELIVVDNGSPDERVRAASAAAGARIVALQQNRGFAGGVNAGIDATQAEVVALLNDDAFAPPDWLTRAADVLANGTVGAVSPKLLYAHQFVELRLDDPVQRIGEDPRELGRHIATATCRATDVLDRLVGPGIHPLEEAEVSGTDLRWRWTTGGDRPVFLPVTEDIELGELRINGDPVEVSEPVELVNSAGTYLSARGFGGDVGAFAVDRGQFDTPAPRFGACGAALVTRRDVLERVGGFPSHFFAYYEDLDWSWRLQLAGYEVRYDPSVTVRHVGGLTSGGPAAVAVQGLAARNRFLTLARNAPLGVVSRELRLAHRDEQPPHFWRRLARRLPPAVTVERTRLRRRWVRSPQDVWDQWAGVNETWDDGYSPSSGARNWPV